MNRPAVFFDRDNTLIANDGYLGDPAGVVLIGGAAAAISRARAMGYAVVTVSNQSGVARGLFPESAIHAVNSRLDEMLLDQHPNARIDRHEFCPYHPEAAVERYKRDSDLRKPKPGMLLQAAERLNLDLSRSWVIGDAPRDIEAGKAAGCRTILFTDPALKPSSATEETSAITPDFSATSLEQALDIIEQNQMSKAKPKSAAKNESKNGDGATQAPEDTSPAPVERSPGEVAVPEAHSQAVGAEVETAEKANTESHETDEIGSPETVEADLVTAGVEKSDSNTAEAAGATEDESEPPKSVAPVPAAPPHRMTFAERVKAGTFQPARSATGAPAIVERPKRVIPAMGDAASADPEAMAVTKPRALAAPIATLDPGVKPTEPVSDTELLEPLLQQILEEVRLMRQQQPGTEFAVTKLLAGIVQVLVLPALFFAYLHRDTAGDLSSLLLLATFLQTLTISLLIMGRQQ